MNVSWLVKRVSLGSEGRSNSAAPLLFLLLFGTSGPFVTVSAHADWAVAGMGELLRATSGSFDLEVRVQAPCWIAVEEVRVFVNGRLLTREAIGPCLGTVRHLGVIPLQVASDAHVISRVLLDSILGGLCH